jgi:L-amino acid N-acyltransferase YncA
VTPLLGERLLDRCMYRPAVAPDVERAQLEPRGPHRFRIRVLELDDHPEPAPNVREATAAKQAWSALVTDEVRAFEDDAVTVGPARPELADALFEKPQYPATHASTRELGVHVRVADEAPAAAVEQVGDAGQPTVELDEPRIALEVEVLPFFLELVTRPVGVAVDGDVRVAEQGERLVEAFRSRAGDLHGVTLRTVQAVVAIRRLSSADWPAVARIYEQGLATGSATFETSVPSWEQWDAAHLPEPRLVAELAGVVAGWLAVAPVSHRAVYRGVVEHSVYVAGDARGRGVGRALLDALVRTAPEHGIWTIQTSIFPENEASLTLHRAVGFRDVGRRERIGQLHGAWRDTLLLELRLA